MEGLTVGHAQGQSVFQRGFIHRHLLNWIKISTYIPTISMKIFFQSNYTDYGHFDKKKYIEIFSSETWTELIFGWSTFKIICDTSAPILKYKHLIGRNFEWRAWLSDTHKDSQCFRGDLYTGTCWNKCLWI
jgi:hypothetical protein